MGTRIRNFSTIFTMGFFTGVLLLAQAEETATPKDAEAADTAGKSKTSRQVAENQKKLMEEFQDLKKQMEKSEEENAEVQALLLQQIRKMKDEMAQREQQMAQTQALLLEQLQAFQKEMQTLKQMTSVGEDAQQFAQQMEALRKLREEFQKTPQVADLSVVGQIAQQVQGLGAQVQQLEKAVRSSMAPARKLSIPAFDVQGVTIDKNLIDASLQPLTRKKLTVDEIQAQVKDTIKQVYERQGIRGVQVIIPPQEINDAPVRVDVIEPKLGDITVTGNKYFSEKNVKRFFEDRVTTEQGVLNARALENQVNRANRHPDRQIGAVLSPGEEAGVTDLTLNVSERAPFLHHVAPLHFAVEVNNKGTPNVGTLRVENTLQYTNLFNRDQTATLEWVFNPENFNAVQVVGFSGSLRRKITLNRFDTMNCCTYGESADENCRSF